MTSMHRREKRSSFCSLIDIFFKIDIILVRIYHRRVHKLAGSPWCGKSRYGETYHPNWELGKKNSTETIWRSFGRKKKKRSRNDKIARKSIINGNEKQPSQQKQLHENHNQTKKEWISFFSPDKSGFFLSFSMTDCCCYY